MADTIAEHFDENGNAFKAELLNEILDRDDTTETVTTVTIETTLTKVTSSTEESIVASVEKAVIVASQTNEESDDQRSYECINDQDNHGYAEVTRKISTDVTTQSIVNPDRSGLENNDNENDTNDDDYQNIRDAYKNVTVSIEKTVVVTKSAHLENEVNDDDEHNKDRVDSESDVKSISVTLIAEKKETETSFEINGNMHRDFDAEQESYINQSEVVVHKVLNDDDDDDNDDDDDDDDDDDKIAHASDKSTEVTITATAASFAADDSNSTGSILYQNETEEESGSRSVSVTIVKTEVTHHQQKEEEEDGHLVSVLDRELLREKAESLSSLGDNDSIKSEKNELTEKEIVKLATEKKEELEEIKDKIKENYEGKNESTKETVAVSLVVEKNGGESISTQNSGVAKPTSLPQSVELTAQADQRSEIKSPTGIKSPSASGSFVLRNARNKDAMHFMQHIRNMANGQPNDLEKGEILTILRSTSIEDKVASSKPSNRHSIVTTDVFRQFETASSGTGGVFPQSRTTRSVSVIEGKQPSSNGEVTISKTQTIATDVGKTAEVDVKTTTVTVTKNSADKITATSNTKELKSSEMLAKQLELKLKAKEQQKQEELEKRTQTTIVITNGTKSSSSEIDTLVRPSSLKDGVTASAQNSGRVPQWQLDLKERNRSKRSTSGSVTPTSPNNDKPITSPQSPPWLVDLKMKNVKVTSINDEGSSSK